MPQREEIGKFGKKKTVSKVSTKKARFKIWKRVTIGTHKNSTDLLKAIRKAGINISTWGLDILQRTPTSQSEIELDLVKVSVAELGLKKEASHEDIYERAIRFGFQLCPAEVGPQLRLNYKDQPQSDDLKIAMEPITVSSGSLRLFKVVCFSDGSKWLLGQGNNPSFFNFYGGNCFIFVRPRKIL